MESKILKEILILIILSVLSVDEIFSTPKWLLEKLYFAMKKYDGYSVYIGHEKQCGAINKVEPGHAFMNGGKKYRYSKTDMFYELTGGCLFEKEYVFGEGRFKNQKTLDVINYHAETGLLPDWYKFKGFDPTLKTNISKTNNTRKMINKYHSKKIKIGDKCVLRQCYDIKIDGEVKRYGKNHRFICETIDTEKINGVFLIKDVELGYCMTANTSQGGTIRTRI